VNRETILKIDQCLTGVYSESRAAFHTINSEFLTEWPLRVG